MTTSTRDRSQADGSSEPLNNTPPAPPVRKKQPSDLPSDVDPADEHLGATEDEMSDTPAPSGEDYNDEPRQG